MGGIDFAYPAHITKLTLRTLWRQVADPRRPVGERRAYAGPMAGAPARTEQVVSGSTRKERAAPIDVVTAIVDVLAGDPDGIAVHGGCAEVTPARAERVWVVLLLVTRKAIVRGICCVARDVGPRTDAGERVDRRIRGGRVRAVPCR